MSESNFWAPVLLLIASVQCANSSKILVIGACAAQSHHIWNSALIRALGNRGHEMTYLSPDIDPNSTLPNTRQLHVENFYPTLYQDKDFNLESYMMDQDVLNTLRIMNKYDQFTTKFALESKAFQQLLKIVKSEKFDLLIFDITMNAGLLNIADYMKDVPIVGVSALGFSHPLVNYLSGGLANLAVFSHAGAMSIRKRLENAGGQIFMLCDWYYNILPRQTQLARTKFPTGQDLESIFNRLSLYLINADISLDPVVPKVPAVINVGGLHIEKPKPLPKEVQIFLDEARHGAVLFSLGTNIRYSTLNFQAVRVINETIEELAPVRVLWKFDVDILDAPSNVMIRNWFPQSDVLAHPNIKLFITHSGLLSTQEATYRGVPVLGVPFFVDQFMNIERCKSLGFGEKYDIKESDKSSFKRAITNMLNNPKYKENAEKKSKIFKDQPETPLERAVFWTEYVIRHKGAPHLRADSLRLSWYQNMLLDVVAISLAAVLILLWILLRIVKKICKKVFSSTKKLKKQ